MLSCPHSDRNKIENVHPCIAHCLQTVVTLFAKQIKPFSVCLVAIKYQNFDIRTKSVCYPHGSSQTSNSRRRAGHTRVLHILTEYTRSEAERPRD